MRLDDLVDICRRDAAIPHRIGIDDDVGAMLALVEASGLVGAHCPFHSPLCQLDLEDALQFSCAGGITAAARVIGRPLVATNEDMLYEFRHALTHSAGTMLLAFLASQGP